MPQAIDHDRSLTMADSSPLLAIPIEIWDRVLFWMSLSPRDVANFAKASKRCHFLAFGPVGDRNEYNVLQHGALLGPRIIELDEEDDRYFKYINLYSGFPIDRVLLSFLRMADRGQAARCFETAICYCGDDPDFEGDDLLYCIENAELGGRTKKLLRRLAEEFGPSDFVAGRVLMHSFWALSGVTYGDGPPDEAVEGAAKFAALGGHPELLKDLLARSSGVKGALASMEHTLENDNFKCYEVAMDHIVSKRPPPGATLSIFEQFYFSRGLRERAAHRYNMRLFQEVAKGALVLRRGGQLERIGAWARGMILRDDNPAELMRLIVGSEATRRILKAGTAFFNSNKKQSIDSLAVLELAIEVGHAVFSFASFSEVFDAATRWGQHSTLAILVLRVELDLGANAFARERALISYAKWFGGRILIPLCEDHDWAALRREVEDFASDAPAELLSVCFQEVSRRIPGSRKAFGTDSGLTAVRQIVVAFTPWLFGGE